MSHDFCSDIQRVGSQFDVNNMKAWIPPVQAAGGSVAILSCQYESKSEKFCQHLVKFVKSIPQRTKASKRGKNERDPTKY